jgi:hypothetical protein
MPPVLQAVEPEEILRDLLGLESGLGIERRKGTT